MRIYIFIITVLSLVFYLPAKIPLNKAVEAALAKESLMKNAGINKMIAGVNKDLNVKKRSITADLNASYLFRSEKMEIDLPDSSPAPGITVPGMSFEAGSLHNFDINLGIKKSLYTGNMIPNSIKIAGKNIEIAHLSSEITASKIVFLVKSSFVRYLLLKNTLETLKIVKKRLETHLGRVNDLKKEGLISRSEQLNAELKVGEIDLEINNIKSALNEQNNLFRKMSGYSINEIDEGCREEILPKRESIEFFRKNHPLMKIFQRMKERSFLEEKIIEGNYLPLIAVFSELHYGKPGINFFENRWKFYIQAGLKFSLNLFDSDKKGAKKKIIHYKRDKIKNEQADIVLNLKKNIDDLYGKIKTYTVNLKIAEILEKKAGEESFLKKELFLENEISGTEYLDSILNVKKFRTKKIGIMLSLEMAKISINNLIGREVLYEK